MDNLFLYITSTTGAAMLFTVGLVSFWILVASVWSFVLHDLMEKYGLTQEVLRVIREKKESDG